MKKIVILSGKGGVGKSSISASLAVSMAKDKKIVCADCDVDASNLSLLFGLKTEDYEEWKTLSTDKRAVVDEKKCIKCGKCIETCYFKAMKPVEGIPKVDEFGCEGCGACKLVCPVGAITLVDVENASVGYAKTKQGFMIASAQLRPGASGSGKIVFEVKKKATTKEPEADIMIIDSAAGIGCPVIASVTGSDAAIIVTEPTPSGYSDMKRALAVVDHFKIKRSIIINKSDLNEEMSHKIEQFCKEKDIPIIQKIPFDKAFVKAMTEMKPIIEYEKRYEKIFEEIKKRILEL